MAKNYDYPRNVRYKCGHSAKLDISARYGAEADLLAYNMRQKDCPECCAKKMDRTQALMTAADQAGLPALAGSPQQVTWALGIRQRIYKYLAKAVETDYAKSICTEQTAAKWWIDHRESHPASFIFKEAA